MNKYIIKINKIIKEEQKDMLNWYKNIIDDSSDKLTTKDQKIAYLEDIEQNDDYENLAYSQGFLQGLKTAIRLLEN
jgi:hypothetical protein